LAVEVTGGQQLWRYPRSNGGSTGAAGTLQKELNVDTVRSFEDPHMDQHLVVRSRRQWKKRTQGKGGGSRKMMAATRRLMILRAVHIRKGPGRDSVARRTPKKRTFVKRRRKTCKSGIKDRTDRRQLQLRIERTSDKIVRKTVKLEVTKRMVGLPKSG
jgi:hypothetical protein